MPAMQWKLHVFVDFFFIYDQDKTEYMWKIVIEIVSI